MCDGQRQGLRETRQAWQKQSRLRPCDACQRCPRNDWSRRHLLMSLYTKPLTTRSPVTSTSNTKLHLYSTIQCQLNPEALCQIQVIQMQCTNSSIYNIYLIGYRKQQQQQLNSHNGNLKKYHKDDTVQQMRRQRIDRRNCLLCCVVSNVLTY